ncbi:hypothetical protein [Mycobacteroides abscessus]|uniref:hypothetical protein n=1 Tax=Mycobacteroides abscessus TaxID=36809 RepID=UPI0013000FB8|nr:hypothetical protein [Mycobacteroides abscessus]
MPGGFRAFAIFWGVLGGCLAGVFSAGLAWLLITFVLKPFVGMTDSVVDQTVGSGPVGDQAGAAGVLVAWVIVAAVAVVGVGVAVLVGEKLVTKQIDSAKLHVHVDLYRDIIEEHMRSEAGRLSLLKHSRPAGPQTIAHD